MRAVAEHLHHLYAALAPWSALALLLLGRSPFLSLTRIFGSLFLAFFLLRIPIAGGSCFQWLMVLEPNPSFTLTGLLVVALGQRVSGVRLFHPSDWKAGWIFGAIASIVLYPMALGLTVMDPYSLGWKPELPVVVATAAIILILRRKRFGIILILPFVGFLLRLQESHNFWDAVIDPFYGGMALIISAALLVKKIRKGKEF